MVRETQRPATGVGVGLLVGFGVGVLFPPLSVGFGVGELPPVPDSTQHSPPFEQVPDPLTLPISPQFEIFVRHSGLAPPVQVSGSGVGVGIGVAVAVPPPLPAKHPHSRLAPLLPSTTLQTPGVLPHTETRVQLVTSGIAPSPQSLVSGAERSQRLPAGTLIGSTLQ